MSWKEDTTRRRYIAYTACFCFCIWFEWIDGDNSKSCRRTRFDFFLQDVRWIVEHARLLGLTVYLCISKNDEEKHGLKEALILCRRLFLR